MSIARRDFLATTACAAIAAALAPHRRLDAPHFNAMYGLISKATTVAGQRDAFIALLLDSTANMPGCLSYVVARDANDANVVWITEVWDSQASHDASLSLPRVRDAIARGRPLIAAFGERIITAPAGGQGLPGAAR